MEKIGMIGAGAWGTAVAKVLAENGHFVEMWSFESDVAESINTTHKNNRYLPGVLLPENISADTDIQAVISEKDILILALPSVYLLQTVKNILTIPQILEGKSVIAVLTKGFIEINGTAFLITEALERYLPGSYREKLVYVSGPSHAEEVARGKLTGLVAASKSGKNAIKIKNILNGKNLIVFPSLDIIGVQVCGAIKNVIAIAFGMLDAIKELSNKIGDNTESLLLAAGLNEIQQIGMALGATHPETFTSIAGVGDLDVTCRSEFGRNRRFGREIILAHILSKYNDIHELLDDLINLSYLPEGVYACYFAISISKNKELKLPIIQAVYRILNRDIEPIDAIELLLSDLRP